MTMKLGRLKARRSEASNSHSGPSRKSALIFFMKKSVEYRVFCSEQKTRYSTARDFRRENTVQHTLLQNIKNKHKKSNDDLQNRSTKSSTNEGFVLSMIDCPALSNKDDAFEASSYALESFDSSWAWYSSALRSESETSAS